MDSDEDRKYDSTHTRHTHNSNDSDASMDEQGDTINRLRNKQDYYDPDQDKNLKRSIRKGYRSLIDKAEEQSVDVSNVTAKQLTAEMMKANSLYDNVRAPQEATLDSRFLIVQSEMSAAKARAMKIDADSFDLDEFLNRFKSVAGGFNIDDHLDQDVNEEDEHNVTIDWGIISNVALKHTRRIPVSDFMLGTIPEEAKKRTKRATQRINKNNEEKTAPTEITENDIQRAENETTTNVKKISELLELVGGDDGINLFKFFINPDNFAQSVENLFYVSFLIRDGHASLSQDEETKEMILLACLGPTQEDYKQGLSKQQVVFELDMETWETAKEMYSITTTIIPTRDTESDSIRFLVR
ncbi:Non-structural maintenance of chromosome element 4 [Wallemia ichthyophaga EXF-994]|uniref:Non-structural maintenance of chromosomes element 4 n=1 Tax=Wallemia ichthyophaga (strain EXF-994 / CBS 113033) TaxID=1299270 RepID=R9A9Q4_WALI9|nr:Non-structural maintenance of chromosome element 4 [Wallemia ichthyophaga EXF-994]EOQ98958.1 Non-structural maintenance of chromosome element 4 [Wallemia ichthyophaga EXF-994]